MAMTNKDLKAAFMAAQRPQWNRAGILAWQENRAPETLKREAYFIGLLTARAQYSKTAKAALDWAKKNDVIIMMAEVGAIVASYGPDTGVVFVAYAGDDSLAIDYSVGSLTHEIRHFYQDANSLLYGRNFVPTGFAKALLALALYEADASAHGQLARYELANRALSPLAARNFLREKFSDWGKGALPVLYGDQCVRTAVSRLGIRRSEPEAVKEALKKVKILQPAPGQTEPPPPPAPWLSRPYGFEPDTQNYISLLGESFGHGNYLDDPTTGVNPPLFSPSAYLREYLKHCPEDKKVIVEIEHLARIRRGNHLPARSRLPR